MDDGYCLLGASDSDDERGEDANMTKDDTDMAEKLLLQLELEYQATIAQTRVQKPHVGPEEKEEAEIAPLPDSVNDAEEGIGDAAPRPDAVNDFAPRADALKCDDSTLLEEMQKIEPPQIFREMMEKEHFLTDDLINAIAKGEALFGRPR